MEGYAAAKAGISYFAEIRSFVTETGRSSQKLSADIDSVQCCFVSTETMRLIRHKEPRTATSTFTEDSSQ